MYCTKCGHKLVAEDKFCSGCGAKVVVKDDGTVETVANEINTTPDVDKFSLNIDDSEPLFEPFDFKAFGFDFENLGLGEGVDRDEKTGVPEVISEEFNWNTGEFPDREASKTEDIDFNWSLTPDEPKKAETVAVEPEPIAVEEIKLDVPEVSEKETPAQEEEKKSTLEEELFGDLNSKTDETRKQSEEIDKFFTFNQKNEEFQKILDREYEKVKTGNILTEEINVAEAASEEKFTARKPEDPMEAMFAAEGVIKSYEPKPIETDVLDRIEAAEQEKKIREDAEKLIEEERARKAAEAEAVEAEVVDVEPVAIEVEDETPAAEVIEENDAVEVVEVVNSDAELAESELVEEESEEEPVKTKQVDKAAILAGMAAASEMVERDRAFAAAQAAAEAEAATQGSKIELPDFLGHEELTEEAEPAAEIVEEQEEETPAAVEEPETEEEVGDGVEVDIFEQLESMEEQADPVEEIVLPEEQTIEELFADIAEDVSKEPQKSFTEHTLVLTEDSVAEILNASSSEPVAENTSEDTMVFTAHTLGAILAEAEQSDPDAEEVVVSMEDLIAAENAVSGEAAAQAGEEEEEIKGGKGRLVLKICLVILIILLLIEIAGIGVKILAPTSGAADFIDVQIKKVFDLLGTNNTTVTALNDAVEVDGTVYHI